MIDLLKFLATQFFNIFIWLDSISVYKSLSLLKVIIIIALFMIALKLLGVGGKKNE